MNGLATYSRCPFMAFSLKVAYGADGFWSIPE